MEDYLLNLMENYTAFKYKVAEYSTINEVLKKYTKEKESKTLVDYYSLTLRTVDKSVYKNELTDYLLENNLKNYLTKTVNEKNLSKLMQDNLIDNDFVMLNTIKENTVLDIKLLGLNESLAAKIKEVEKQIKSIPMLKLIQRRELLKLEINELRQKYYKFAKLTKDELVKNGMKKYRFKFDDSICAIEIKTKSRVYNNELIEYLESHFPLALQYKVDNAKLLKSKSKKINREEIDSFKVEKYQEYLYVSMLKGLYNKKMKKQKEID